MTAIELLNKINRFILNPIIYLVFAIAFIVFVFGIVQFMTSLSKGGGSDSVKGKRAIAWGLFGMFVMFSAYGLIRIVLNTFDIPTNSYLPL